MVAMETYTGIVMAGTRSCFSLHIKTCLGRFQMSIL